MKTTLIAPCGINCALCYAYLRDKNKCDGCRGDESKLPNSCRKCSITDCETFIDSKKKFCFECTKKFPCRRLKQLDKRYRDKYHMSMLDNLEKIKEMGIRKFVTNEKKRWACKKCGEVICIHHHECSVCGEKIGDGIRD